MKLHAHFFILLLFSIPTVAQNLNAEHSWDNGSGSQMSINAFVDVQQDEVILTFTGPLNNWFSYGFGNTQMEGTYALIFERSNGSTVISERQLGNHTGGNVLTSRYSLISESTDGSLRTIVISLPRQGNSSYFTFPAEEMEVPIISAVGYGESLGFHGGDNYMQGFSGGINDLEFSTIVPVIWSNFNLSSEGYHTKLTWETALEIDNAGFYIEHSSDGDSWNSIEFIEAGNEEGQKYSYVHESSLPGVNYYRLKQVDQDGSEHFSVVKSIDIQGDFKAEPIHIFPNPVTDILNIEFENTSGPLRIQVIDMNFQVVKDKIWLDPSTSDKLNVSALPSGHYLILFKHKKWSLLNQFIKQ